MILPLYSKFSHQVNYRGEEKTKLVFSCLHLPSLTWTGSDSAAGYRVWSRNINTQGSQLQLIGNVTMTSSSCNDQYFLFPGTWNYAFALSAFNGNLESDKGPEVAAPSPPSSVTIGTPGPTCAPEPAWCSDGGSVSVPPVGGGSPTTTAGGTAPTVTGYPVVTNGRCTGRDCVGGKCVGKYSVMHREKYNITDNLFQDFSVQASAVLVAVAPMAYVREQTAFRSLV